MYLNVSKQARSSGVSRGNEAIINELDKNGNCIINCTVLCFAQRNHFPLPKIFGEINFSGSSVTCYWNCFVMVN